MLTDLVQNTAALRDHLKKSTREPPLKGGETVRLKRSVTDARLDPMWTLLVQTLKGAAQLEHGLACAYLFAAYSIKRPDVEPMTPEQEESTRSWRTTFHLVARQEMEHLAMVTNMLTAIGEAPSFARIPFPIEAKDMPEGLPLTLRPLDLTTLQTFILWERPRMSDLKPLRDQLEKMTKALKPPVEPVHFIGRDGNVLPDSVFQRKNPPATIYTVYRTILDTFESLCETYGEKGVFVGNPQAQYAGSDPNFRVMVQTVRSLEDVRSAVFQILEEGEGMPFEPETMPATHFHHYLEMYAQVAVAKKDGFDAARPTIDNPTVEPTAGRTTITHPATAKVAVAFDLAYDTQCIMLERFYAHSAEDGPGRIRALAYISFMPMMTNVIRPLGEVLSQMPATTDPGSPFAGPPFQAVSPEAGPFWGALDVRLKRLVAEMKVAADAAAATHPREAERLRFVHENLEMMIDRFWTYTGSADSVRGPR